MGTFEEALRRCKAEGAGRADDQATMAGFCQSVLQHLVGAVSPKLVWEGAVTKGLNSRQLADLAAKNPLAVCDLQWL